MSDPTRVRVSQGVGYIARRSDELIFSPTDADVVRAFDLAALGEGIDAVTAYAEEHDFEVGDFVVIDWSADLRVAVFGEVEVTSDHRSLPRLSAAGAGTWVERSMRRVAGEVTIGVAVDQVSAETDLRAGVVQAGGFALTCTLGGRTDLSEHQPETERAAPVPSAAAAQPVASAPIPDSADVPRMRSDVPFEPNESDDVAAPPSVEAVPSVSSTAAVEALAASVFDGSASSTSYAAAPDDVTVVPDHAIRAQISSLVEDTSAPPVHHEHWRIVFADGAREDIDRTLVLGRKPTLADDETENTTRLVALDSSQVSSRHLTVRAVNGAVEVTDLGSSNGSFVLTTGDGQLIQLDPGVPHQVNAGMIVQIGTKRFFIQAVGQV